MHLDSSSSAVAAEKDPPIHIASSVFRRGVGLFIFTLGNRWLFEINSDYHLDYLAS